MVDKAGRQNNMREAQHTSMNITPGPYCVFLTLISKEMKMESTW